MIRKIIGWPLLVIFTGLLLLNLVAVVGVATAKDTVLNISFIKEEMDKAEVYSVAREWLDENMEGFVPGMQDMEIYQVFRDSLSEEWLADQVETVLDGISDFLDGEIDTLEFSLSMAGFKENMKAGLRDTILESPPEGVEGLSDEELDEYLEAAYSGIDELPEGIVLVVEDAAKLEPIRYIPKVTQSLSSILLMTAGLSAIIIVFLHLFVLRSTVKRASRHLGVSLLATGLFCFIVKLVATSIASSQIDRIDLPSPLTTDLVTRVVRDGLAPAGTYSFVIIAAGTVLIVASFFLVKGRAAKQA